ncbi:MAG: hypothetical protein ACTJGR_07985 [Pauljensenia sp.]
MSTPNDPTPDESPRFGQRSPGWKPEDESATQPAQSSDTPWPQYGQTSGSAPGSPWPQAGTPGGPGAQTGAQAGPQIPVSPGYGSQPPYEQQNPGVPSGPYGPAGGAPVQPLPSRAWAIVLIVVGALTATVLAFGVFLTVLLAGAGFQDLVSSASAVTSGSTVTVDQSGSYLVSATGGEAISCTLEGSDGSTHALGETTGNSSVVLGMGIPAGDYTLECTGADTGQLVGMTGVDASTLTSAGTRSFLWGTVVGVLGIALTIGGIIWLVKVNRRRRELQRGQWNMGPYRA